VKKLLSVILLAGACLSFAHALNRYSSLFVVGPAGQIKELGFSATLFWGEVDRGIVPSGGRIIAAGDFDSNGVYDLVLQYDPDGAGPKAPGTFLWLYAGGVQTQTIRLGGIPAAYTRPIGTCDMDGDGNLEYAMANPLNGKVQIVEISHLAPNLAGERRVVAVAPKGYKVVGVNHMRGILYLDFLAQDTKTHTVKVVYTNGIAATGLSLAIPYPATTEGSVVGVVNVPGFGRSAMIEDSPDGITPRMWIQFQDPLHNGNWACDTFIPLTTDPYISWKLVAIGSPN
jgi:hypothetical protein